MTKSTRNESDEVVVLDEAYLISGITGKRRDVQISVGAQWATIPEIEPIVPRALVHLQIDFNELQGGMSETEFLLEWGRTFFIYAINGKPAVKELMDENFFKNYFDHMKPMRTVEPRVTLKKK